MDIGAFKEISEAIVKKFTDSPLGRMTEGKVFDKPMSEYDKPLWKAEMRETFLPRENGEWDGIPGDSTWKPDRDYIPPERTPSAPYSNRENKTWGEILDKYGIDGITFKNGYPDFSEISKGTVKIDGFETGGTIAKNHNFVKADIELAKQKGCSPEEVTQWRKENNHTWHECEDKMTMQKVPNEVHANVPHEGGRSQD